MGDDIARLSIIKPMEEIMKSKILSILLTIALLTACAPANPNSKCSCGVTNSDSGAHSRTTPNALCVAGNAE